VRVKRELKDKEMQLTALQAKLDMVGSNSSEYKKRLEEAMTELTQKERNLIEERSKVQVLTVEMKTSSIAARATDEQASHIHELQSEVKMLRDTNDKISAVAMSGEREQQHENRVSLFKEKIQQLELQCRAEMQEKSELMKKLGTEQEIRAEILAESRDQQKALLSISAERDKLEQRMKFFTSESAVDIEEMEKALLIVKKRKEHGDDLDFLLPMNERESIDLRKQLKNTTAAYAETVSELEKARQLLRIQDDISREYKSQAEDAETKAEELERSFAAKCLEYDKMLENRGARINKLEKQLRDIAYGTNQYPVKPATLHGVDDARARTTAPEIHPGQNLLEICVSRAELSAEAINEFKGVEACTFVTFDFFHFETEHTAIRYGQFPRYDSISQYVVEVDEAFLQYLRKGTMTVELHQTIDINYKTLAACQIRFTDLLSQSKYGARKKVLGKASLVSLRDPGTVYAEVEFWMRVQVPIDQSLRLYRERQKALAYAEANEEKGETLGVGMAASTLGLKISILSCTAVQSRRPGMQPSCYVAFKFHTLDDVTTPTVTSSNNPMFGHDTLLQVPPTKSLQSYLMESAMELFVVDDGDPDMEAYLGVAAVPLAALAISEPVAGQFDLIAPQGVLNGQIEIKIEWMEEYHPPGSAGSNLVGTQPPPLQAGGKPVPDTRHVPIDEPSVVEPLVTEPAKMDSQQAAADEAAPLHPTTKVTPAAPNTQLVAPPAVVAQRKAPEITVDATIEDYESDFHDDDDDSTPAAKTGKPAREATTAKSGDEDATHPTTAEHAPAPAPGNEDVLSKPGNTTDATSQQGQAPPAPDAAPPPASEKAKVVVPKKGKQPSKATSKRDPIPPANVGVDGLLFVDGAAMLADESVQQLFVSFQFLDVELDRLESPQAHPKPATALERLNFDHHCHFVFDNSPETGDFVISGPGMSKKLRQLAKQIQTERSAILTFDVVSEPASDNAGGVCRQVAFAFVDLAEVWRERADMVNEELQLFDYDAWHGNPQETVIVGKLFVTITLCPSLQALVKKKKKK